MAEKTRSEKFYGKPDKKGDAKKSDAKSDAKVEHPHVKERKETFDRHAKAREDMHKQQEEEIAAMATRHAAEGMTAGPGTEGGAAAPAAGPAAGAAGAAAGTPPAVAGTTAA